MCTSHNLVFSPSCTQIFQSTATNVHPDTKTWDRAVQAAEFQFDLDALAWGPPPPLQVGLAREGHPGMQKAPHKCLETCTLPSLSPEALSSDKREGAADRPTLHFAC